MSKNLLIGSSIALTILIITLALSAYGLGREENNKSGAGYQSATAFTGISTVGIIISLIVLIVAIFQSPGVSNKLKVGPLPPISKV